MTRVIVDEALRTVLHGVQEQVEFCDGAGRTLGYYLPQELPFEKAQVTRKVVIDPVWEDKFNGRYEKVELCDEFRRPMGRFLPLLYYLDLQTAIDQCPYTEEELARFRQESGGRTLAEIWKSLGRS